MQSKQYACIMRYYVWLVGIADQNARFLALVQHLEGRRVVFFYVYDSLTTPTAHHDAYTLRFANFLWTPTMMTDRQTDHFTPAHARGVIIVNILCTRTCMHAYMYMTLYV